MGSLSVVLVALIVAGIAVWMHRVGAPGPRLTEDLAPAMLARAGFPATRHNVVVLRERLGEAFLAEARALDARGAAGTAEWDRVAAACERARLTAGDPAGWPQLVLDEIAAVDPGVAATVAHRCPSMLLEAVGSGHGVLGGSVFAPLPAPIAPIAVTHALPAPRIAADRLVPVVPGPRAAV